MSEVAVAPMQYKESGVQWLGKIPAHWEVKRIKDLSELQSGETITSQQLTDEGYPVYGGNGKRGYFSRYNLQGEYILIGRQGALCGNINYASGKFWASEHAVVVYKDKAVNTVWYGELLRIMNLNQYSLAAAQPGLSVDKIKRLELPFAPVAEQEAIADYILDHTAAIDRKIDLLGQKIKLYQTLRKTLINETVCRGLHPHAPRKDSGIEWIGEIPAHWQVRRLKDVGFIYSGLSGKSGSDFQQEASEQTKDFIPFTNIANNLYIDPSDFKPVVISEDEGQNEVRENDLFFLMSSEGYEDIGKTSLLTVPVQKTYLNSFCKGFRITHKSVSPRYLNHALNARMFRERLMIQGKGFTRINLKIEKVTDFEFIVPPLAEQLKIVDFLETKLAGFKRITDKLTTQIATLKELRKTLINDVVTGKLNVTA